MKFQHNSIHQCHKGDQINDMVVHLVCIGEIKNEYFVKSCKGGDH